MPRRDTSRYNSPRRKEQAAATREAIISAAGRLFAERGYAGTTMAAIAAEARVAVKTVHTLAEKPQLLLLAVDRAIAGDTAPVAMADRPAFARLIGAPTPRTQVRLAAEAGAETLTRLYPIYRAFEQAAATDAVLQEHWREYQRRRRQDVVRVVHAIAAAGGLRPELSEERAVDSLWALITWHPVALLTEERGWTPEQLTTWLEGTLAALLLASGDSR